MVFDSDVPAPFFTGAPFFLLPNMIARKLRVIPLCLPLSLCFPESGRSALFRAGDQSQRAELRGAPAAGGHGDRLLLMLLSWRRKTGVCPDVHPADVTEIGFINTMLKCYTVSTASDSRFLT